MADINKMLKFLPKEDALSFLDELKAAVSENSTICVDRCIDDWEDVVELHSISGFLKNTMNTYYRFRKLDEDEDG